MTGTRTEGDGESDEILVLHVDDDEQVSELTGDYLERLDDRVDVRTETEPDEALDRLATTPFDCVVSDFQMPGMDGIELLRRVRGEYPNLPFVLFTGKGSESVASDAIDGGVTAYVPKGGTEAYDQLVNQVRNAVDHRRSERRARVAEDRLLALYEQTDGFYILDGDWRVAYWNQTIAERTGQAADDVLDRSFWAVFPEARDTELHDRFRDAMATREPASFETHLESLDYWAEIRAYPVEDGLFVHSRNVTGEKERERELERRNHILESFANTVSHDLRNPLNVAEGRLQLAQETGDFDHLDEVARAHNRMRNLIDELLRVARGDELSVSTVSIQAVAEAAWETVDAPGTALDVTGDVTIRAHESQLRRLLENLLWNAIEHGDAATVRVGPLGDAGFFVEDDGTGIPPEDREAVFESGFTTTDSGAGYGLSIVDGIVDTHGWRIRVAESDDGGARFEITDVGRPD